MSVAPYEVRVGNRITLVLCCLPTLSLAGALNWRPNCLVPFFLFFSTRNSSDHAKKSSWFWVFKVVASTVLSFWSPSGEVWLLYRSFEEYRRSAWWLYRLDPRTYFRICRFYLTLFWTNTLYYKSKSMSVACPNFWRLSNSRFNRSSSLKQEKKYSLTARLLMTFPPFT